MVIISDPTLRISCRDGVHHTVITSGADKIFSCLPAKHLLPGKATTKEKTHWTKHAPEGCGHRAAVQKVDLNNLDDYKTVRFEDPE